MGRLPGPHFIQARLAFGGGASDHGRQLGLVVAVEGDVVSVRFPLRGCVWRYQVDSRKRLQRVLRDESVLRLGGRAIVIVSDRYHALQVPCGPREDAARLAAGYGVVIPPGDLPAGATKPGGFLFNVRRGPGSAALEPKATPDNGKRHAMIETDAGESKRSATRRAPGMTVAQIWRYPVKTMGGERLERARIGPMGIEGDRVVHVEDARGRLVTSRSHPRFLGHKGTLGPDGEPRVDGQPWASPGVGARVVDIAGPGARLVRFDGIERFDVLPLLVATDGAIAAFGHDGRRLRPNIVIGGVAGLAERDWPGSRLRIGSVVIGVEQLRQRCIMTSFDPDTQVQDRSVTRGIFERFGGTLALDCFVVEGGEIAVGDAVERVPGLTSS